jgi:regulation of enolase protein 1 (concanavalin A-like superfamily)
MFHVNHIAISDNTFDYVGQGISMSQIGDAADLTDIQILRNTFTRVYRMAMEIQTGSAGHPITGLIVDHNVGYNWVNAYVNSFGISLASYSQNAQLTNNYFDGSPVPGGSRFGFCLEVDGANTLVSGNTCVASNNTAGWGFGNSNAVVSGTNAIITGNTFCGGSQTISTETSWATYSASGNVFPPCGPVMTPPSTGSTSDTTPPSIPAGLTANPGSSTQVALAWSAATDNVAVTGYNIFRNGAQIGTATGTTYQDSGLAPSTLYSYTVSAYDAAGNQSGNSGTATATTLASTIVGPVITAVIASPSTTGATITWTTSRAATSQIKYGATTTYGTTTTLNSTLVTSHSVAVSGMSCGSTYHYSVVSTDAGGANPSTSPDATFATSACASSTTIVSDNFDSSALNTSLWHFVNPVGDAKISLNGREAVISLPAGKSHDLWTSGDYAARLMQAAPNTDFQIELKIDSTAIAQYQMQGLIAEQDASNYVRFEILNDGGGPRLFGATFTANSPTVTVNQWITSGGPVWLRLTRSGNTWTGSYSFNGSSYLTGVTFRKSLKIANVGFYAGNNGEYGGPAPAFTGVFDYFFNTASRLAQQ